MTTDPLFTTDDVLNAFPWISAQILHHRIKRGFLPIAHRSRTRGQPNQFSEEELIHAGVVDCLASLGAFVDVKRLHVSVKDFFGFRSVGGARQILDPTTTSELTSVALPGPFDTSWIFPMYRSYDYRVSAYVTLSCHHVETTRTFLVEYIPDFLGAEINKEISEETWSHDTAGTEVKKWRCHGYGQYLAMGIVSVRKVYEEARTFLGLK